MKIVKMMHYQISFSLLFIVIIKSGTCSDSRRPVYNIGHMANSISEVIPFLEQGANVLESDVQFYPNGSVKEIYHGCPGDCNRICDKKEQLSDYLMYLRNITDPSAARTYYKQLIMQFFDLKLKTSNKKKISGRDIARHVLDYLWTNGEREQEVRALIYIDKVKDIEDVIYGFTQEFKDRGQQSRLKDVGFDGGMGDVTGIRDVLRRLKISNVWLGDGTINCFSSLYPDKRLREEIANRDANGFVKKVYDWTVDDKSKMRNSLDLGVDGFITNIPERLVEVLQEENYKQKFRLAEISDPPFSRFKGQCLSLCDTF